jgi:glutamate formiminotransferase|tara:strand:- start:928 stop:1122 length:195 start_codon:yes stop_codon:yes gene_type:complete
MKKTAAAKIDGNKFVLVAQKYNLDTKDMNTMNQIVNGVNNGLSINEAALAVAKQQGKAWNTFDK